MLANSLGTQPVSYAVDELQNPFPVQQCCLKVIGIAMEGEMVSFQIAKAFALYERGRDSQLSFLLRK